MKYFVLVYDRPQLRILDLREFPESDYTEAEAFRLDAQRKALREYLDQDIILFQAGSVERLKRTHGSYFFTADELLDRLIGTLKEALSV